MTNMVNREIASQLYRGDWQRSNPDGVIPVLFGTRLIENPRIVWARTRGLPEITTGSSPPDSRSFVLLAALCYGELEELLGLWCNSVQVNSQVLDFLITHPEFVNRGGRFQDSRFFSERYELSGYLAVTPGTADQVDLFDNLTGELALKPAETDIQFRGVAMAHLYVSEQNSSSFNNWSFLAKSIPSGDWLEDKRQIEVDRFRRLVTIGDEVQERHIVLAVDCSAINAFPVAEATDTMLREAGRGSGYTYDITEGTFRYRYDVIRDTVLQTLDAFVQNLESDASLTRYRFSFEVVLMTAAFGADGEAIPLTFEFEGETVSYVHMWSNEITRAKLYFQAMREATQAHPLLAEATDVVPAKHNPDDYMTLPNRGDTGIVVPTNLRGHRGVFYHLLKTTAQVRARINFSYHQSPGIHTTGTTLGSGALAVAGLYPHRRTYSFVDWSLVFDYVREHRPDAFSQDNPGSLPQVSILTGPAWPTRILSWQIGVTNELTEHVYPSIKDMYWYGRYGSDYSRFNFEYGARADPTAAIHRLYTHMGISPRTVVLTGIEPIRLDAVGFDGFCWGDEVRRGAFSNVGDRNYSSWTERAADSDGSLPSHYDKINIYKDNATQSKTDWLSNRPSQHSEWSDYDNMGVISFEDDASSIAAQALAKGMVAARSPAAAAEVDSPTFGMNPAHIIRRLLINSRYGQGKLIAANDLDNPSFVRAAESLHEERLGLAFVWDKQKRLNEFIDDVLRHIDGVIFERDGKLHLKLIGVRAAGEVWRNPLAMTAEEKTAADGRVFTDDRVRSVTNFKAPREDELVNKLVLQYKPWFSTSYVSAEKDNDDRVKRYGLISKSIRYDGIMHVTTAELIARREFASESAGLITCTLTVTPDDADVLVPGDLVVLRNWVKLQIARAYFRIIKMRFGVERQGRVELDLVQAVPGNVAVL